MLKSPALRFPLPAVRAENGGDLHRRTRPPCRFNITYAGILCLAIIILTGAAALNSETNLLFLLSGIAMGAWLFGVGWPALMVRNIEVRRGGPQAVVAGRAFHLTYHVRNGGRWLRAWSITLCEETEGGPHPPLPLGMVTQLAPGQEHRLDLPWACALRGRIRLRGVRIESRFPFGLLACSIVHPQPGEIIVYPATGRLRRDAWKSEHLGDDAAGRGRRGSPGGEEFYGVREYRQGDSTRWIHWRRSARTGELVVRETMTLRSTMVIVLLDPWPGPSERSEGRAFITRGLHERRRLAGYASGLNPEAERLIAAAATVLCDGLEQGHRVGLVARGARPVVVPPGNGRAHRQRLMHELALLEPGEGEALDQLLARLRWPSGWHARCLLCAGRIDDTHHRVLRFLRSHAESLVVAAPGSPWLENCFQMPAPERG